MPNANTSQRAGYHRFKDDEADEFGYGSFEVFWSAGLHGKTFDGEDVVCDPGWWWHPCFPGCTPDGEAMGPFDTSTEAYNDAQENA